MDRNSIIGFLLIGLVLILFPFYQKEILGVKPLPQQEKQAKSTTVDPNKDILDARQEAFVPDPQEKSGIDAPGYSGNADTLIVETNRYRGVLSTLGGGTVLSWKLKDYEGFN